MARYTALFISGKTPANQPYLIGVSVAMLFPTIECLSIRQYRSFMTTAVGLVNWRAGLGTEAKRAKWATDIQGARWRGHWIPFQDQLAGSTEHFSPSTVPVGLSPENPYPHAMNEVIAAYTDLIQLHGVDSKRIILLGDSAGGNICLGTSLKLRDAFAYLGAPAGQILICPWVRDHEPLESSLYDVVSAIGCEVYVEAYTQYHPEHVESPYTSPAKAKSLSSLSPMLVFIGGVEILRPSIERFVERARGEGTDVKTVLAEGRSHNYFLLDDISTELDRQDAYREMSEFAQKAHHLFLQAKQTSEQIATM
ncbi:hypothetical protein BGZ99_002919 [Dissophora globulifera]|uniref:Alpha/beta hydrolase fold-3 domain-containing protein n=1 Tax=Dissophora globulifera TaxID=979702 RepID=A0A9P6UWS5_9FUNG|nr:hypothetical protein BGZ99_002919 [Dissophora globulifera]